MIVEAKISFKEYLKLSYQLAYTNPVMIMANCIGLIIVFGPMIYSIPSEWTTFSQAVWALVIFVMLPLRIYRTCTVNFRSNERIKEKRSYEFTNDKIVVAGESFKSEYNWEKTYMVRELKNWILIYQSKTQAHILPKVAFGKQLGEFRALVKSKPFIKQKLESGAKELYPMS